MHSQPLVSVVLPVRNGERYVGAAIESILSQTFADFELLVLDDGSDDRTPAILDALARRDARVNVIRTEPAGLVAALNAGCGRARGTYIARMDADDVAMPHRLQTQVQMMERAPALGVLGAQLVVIRDDDPRRMYTVRYPLRDAAIRRALQFGSPFGHPVVILRKTEFERCGGYRAQFLHAEDYDLWLRLAEVCRLANLDRALQYYRTHSTQVTLLQAEQQIISVAAAQIAAGARRAGRPEPFAPDRVVTLDTMRALSGADREGLTDRLIGAGTTTAMQMVLMREPDRATNLLDWVCAIAPDGRIVGRTYARLRLARAAALWSQRQRWRSLRAGLFACSADPITVAQTLWTAARTVVSAGQPI